MKGAYIQTFGCQMNEYDSGRMKDQLLRNGYGITDQLEKADLILLNTCSVRENPENKVYSFVGRLKSLKRKNPNMIVAVGGCVAQQEGENILKRSPTVDIVFGTDNVFKLPEMIREVESGKRVVSTNWMPRDKKVQNFIPENEISTGRVEGCKGMIPITKGCDNYCTFCIVPTTRGRMVSREPENILQEARDLISKGAKELMLIGQNVNSYGISEFGFYDLLKSVADLPGIKRVRFTSPHPNDWTNDLSDLMAAHPNICNQLHLPFQAGSDRILNLMKRGHTCASYLDKIRYLQEKIPNIKIGTDLIVGFPGETEAEFEKTLEVMRIVRFSHVYAFKYSPRPGTKAKKMEDSVPLEVKQKRLERLLDLQSRIEKEMLEGLVGETQSVLIESAHPKVRHAMNGRNDGNIPVTLSDCHMEIGEMCDVKIVGTKAHSLIGALQ